MPQSPADTPDNSGSKRKKAYCFTIEADLSLLCKVYNLCLFSAAYGKKGKAWDEVVANFRCTLGLTEDIIKQHTVEERFGDLMEKFAKEELDSLHASGTEEQFVEWEKLLTEIKELMDEYDEGKRAASEKIAASIEKHEVNGDLLCDAAFKCLKYKKNLSTTPNPNSALQSNEEDDSFDDDMVKSLQDDKNTANEMLELQYKELEQSSAHLKLEQDQWDLEKEE
ncbi:hypothetical protein HK096_004925 [Nowakowskiella sp. JEL0078]|nr:hypothetical protein HK096_004925 [Nowakowskiella sp. JEL0078]